MCLVLSRDVSIYGRRGRVASAGCGAHAGYLIYTKLSSSTGLLWAENEGPDVHDPLRPPSCT